jgi:hypothetical protein
MTASGGCRILAVSSGPGLERPSVTAQGKPRTVFRRAIERDNLVAAELNARIMGNVTLVEALELTAPLEAPLPSTADAPAAGRVDCAKDCECDDESAASDAGRREFKLSSAVQPSARRALSHGLRCLRACRIPFASQRSQAMADRHRADGQRHQDESDHDDVDASGYHVSTIVR